MNLLSFISIADNKPFIYTIESRTDNYTLFLGGNHYMTLNLACLCFSLSVACEGESGGWMAVADLPTEELNGFLAV